MVPSRSPLMMATSGSRRRVPPPRSATPDSGIFGQAVIDALNGYPVTRTTDKRADALAVLAKALERNANYRDALNSLQGKPCAGQRPRMCRRTTCGSRSRRASASPEHAVDTDSAPPRACVTFSEALVKSGSTIRPSSPSTALRPRRWRPRTSRSASRASTYGQTYKIGFRTGLPSSVDEVLEAPVTIDVYIKDRSLMVRFTGDSFVLPSTARRGIPIVSVNMTTANLKLYRIGDRNIAPLLDRLAVPDADGQLQRPEHPGPERRAGLAGIDRDRATNSTRMSSPASRSTRRCRQRKPGVYVLIATPPTGAAQDWDPQATQWFLVSDIGITTYAGTDGLNVFARSLSGCQTDGRRRTATACQEQ